MLPAHLLYRVCSCFAVSGIITAFIYCMLSIILYKTFEDYMQDTELNHLTFILLTFEGVGELIGGFIMIFSSPKIKDPALIFIFTSVLFMVSMLIVFMGSFYTNKYVIGVGVILTGISDCSCAILSMSLAGQWKERGISAFNIVQCLTTAFTIALITFLPLYAACIWMGCVFIFNIVSIHFYRSQAVKNKEI